MTHESPATTIPLYAQAATLGAVAGLRSMTPFVLLAAAAHRRDATASFAAHVGKPLSLLRSRAALLTFGLAAAGEIVVDKLPQTPSRLEPGPLAGRLVLGALVGAAVWHNANRPLLVGVALGAAGAGAGSAAGYYARRALVHATGTPDLPWALAEDTLALGLGAVVLRPYLLA